MYISTYVCWSCMSAVSHEKLWLISSQDKVLYCGILYLLAGTYWPLVGWYYVFLHCVLLSMYSMHICLCIYSVLAHSSIRVLVCVFMCLFDHL